MQEVDQTAFAVRALRPFVPAKDFETSKRFYADLGFRVQALGDVLAEVSLASIHFYCRTTMSRNLRIIL